MKKIIFMGSPDFALPSFEATRAFADVTAVFTQPPRPKGRGQEESEVAVARRAKSLGLPLLQPQSLRKGEEAEMALDFLRDANPDAIVVVAYGLILPSEILALPRHGCINVHGSLLPKYRGAAPVQWAIARGESVTGVTTMRLNEKMDEGPIYLQKETAIAPEETSEDLLKRLSHLGAELLSETLRALAADGSLRPKEQDDEHATYAPILEKKHGEVDWQKSAQEIHNLVRGFYPWPGAHTLAQGKFLKIHRSRVVEKSGNPGAVLGLTEEGILVGCGRGALLLLELQIEGKKRQTAREFAHGQRLEIGAQLFT